MKTVLLVVSFGTTHPDALEKTIAATEAELAAAFPQLPVYRAFISPMIRQRLKSSLDIHVDSVEEALTRIAGDGFDRVVIQPTLLIPGVEYDRLCAIIREAAGDLETVVCKPLLCDDSDLDAMIPILQEACPTDADTVLLLMGHGTAHSANALYIRLAEKMRARTERPLRLCTMESTPSFDDALVELKALPQRKVRLAPLLLVAGSHVKHNMTGGTPDSIRAMLEEAGFTVECTLRGLGELPAVRRLYVRRVMENLNTPAVSGGHQKNRI